MKVNELVPLINNENVAIVDQETDYFVTSNFDEIYTQYGEYDVQGITTGKTNRTIYIAINYCC